MIRAVVQCPVGHDVDAINETFDFEALPWKGDVIAVHFADYFETVRVRRVVHHVAADKGGLMPTHPIAIECEYDARWEIGERIK